jgi:hypothetical protein
MLPYLLSLSYLIICAVTGRVEPRQYFSKSGTPRAPRPLHSAHFSEHSPGCGAIFFTVCDLRRSGRFPPAKTAHLPLWRTEAPSTRARFGAAGREPNLPEQRCRSRARGHGPCASRSQMGRVGLPGAPGRVPQCIDELMFSGALEVPLGHPGSPNSYPRSPRIAQLPPQAPVSHIISSLHRRLAGVRSSSESRAGGSRSDRGGWWVWRGGVARIARARVGRVGWI